VGVLRPLITAVFSDNIFIVQKCYTFRLFQKVVSWKMLV